MSVFYLLLSKKSAPFRFCFNCAKLVDKYHSIKCDAKCYRCGMLECTKDYEDIVHCEHCNIEFCGRQCFNQHLKKRSGSAFTYCHIWERFLQVLSSYNSALIPDAVFAQKS